MERERYKTLQWIRHYVPLGICGAVALLLYAMSLLFSEPRILLAVSVREGVDVPVIHSVTLSDNTVWDGGTITVTVTVRSSAPVNRLSRSLDGPNGNIYGGGSGAAFTEISPGIWQYVWVEVISPWAPSGIYTYSGISVQNEGQFTSEAWLPITFVVTNSDSAEVPVIESVMLSKDEIVNGGAITVTVTVRSNAPVVSLSRSLDGPTGNIYGGGSGTPFIEHSPGIWQYEWVEAISPWAPSGIYTYSNISVRNEGQLASESWHPLLFTVSNFDPAQVPVIQSVVLSTHEIRNGGTITVTVTALSNAPVNSLSRSLDGPGGNIYGGGSGATFIELSPGIWQHEWIEVISPYAPSGVYTYSNISVQNEGRLSSEPWPPLNFTVANEVLRVHLPLLFTTTGGTAISERLIRPSEP